MPNWLWVVLANFVVAVIMAFGAYIWRSQDSRIKKIEADKDSTISKLIAHPVLTVDVHQTICGKKMDEVKEFVGTRTDVLAKQMSDSEVRTGLLIENAILKASLNGKGKARNSKKGK